MESAINVFISAHWLYSVSRIQGDLKKSVSRSESKDWLEKVGFVEVRCIDVTATTDEEQRLTNWKAGQSLADFLDPNDPSKTVEGHPAPLRATIVAKKPDDGRRLPRYA